MLFNLIDRYVSYAKALGMRIGVDLTSDPELFLRGTAYRPGNKPHLTMIKELSNEGEADAICLEVKKLLNKGYSEVDIATIIAPLTVQCPIQTKRPFTSISFAEASPRTIKSNKADTFPEHRKSPAIT